MSEAIVLAKSPEDRRRALAFVRRHVRKLFGGSAPRPSQTFFIAEWRNRICGTIALDFACAAGKFPLEDVYSIDHALTPWPFERKRIAQFGKWWATRPSVAVRLMHAAHLHALREGKELGLAEAKPRIVTRVEEFGMALLEVPGATLLMQRMPALGEGYYAIPPPPRLYMFDVVANAAALTRYVEVH